MAIKLDNVGGWIPVIESILQKHGSSCALVYGVVWRFSQMKAQSCYASQEKIGEIIGMTRRTVNSCLKELIENEYLEVIKASDGFPTNTYRATDKAGLATVAFDQPKGFDYSEYGNF